MTHLAPVPCDPQLWQRFIAACHKRDESPDAVLRELVRRFGTGFHGHPRPSLATVALTRSAGAMAAQSPQARLPTVATPKTSRTLASISGAFMPATRYIASGLA